MREIEILFHQLRTTSESIAGRIAHIDGALYQLVDSTSILFNEPYPADDSIAEWISQEGFTGDDDGYFERPSILELARSGQTDPDKCTYYVHKSKQQMPDVLRRMYCLRNMPPRIRAIRERLGNVEWIYYQDRNNWAMSYPMHDPAPTIPADFDWLAYLTYKSVEPSVNPNREIRWTPPNIDYGGTGLTVNGSLPVYTSEGFIGLWSIDVPVRSLLKDSILETVVPNQKNFIVDKTGALVAHESIEHIIKNEKGATYREKIDTLGSAYRNLNIDALIAAGEGKMELEGPDGVRRIVLYRLLPGVDWLLFVTFPATGVLQIVNNSFQEAFQRLKKGDTSYRIDLESGNELQDLIDGYNEMAAQLEQTLEDRRRLEEQAMHNQKLHAIGRLAGGIAHDFNNLLTVMLNCADLLEQRLTDSANKDLLHHLQVAAQRAASLTTQLLAFSRGGLVQPRPLELDEVLLEVEPLLRQVCRDEIDLSVNLAATNAVMLADRTQITQIIMNLVINSRDAIDGMGKIEISSSADGQTIHLTVSDTGRGMNQETLARVFEPFYTTKSTGTGLGLATVRRIIGEQDGEIKIKSAPNEGTTISINWPKVDLGVAEAEPAAIAWGSLSGKHILIVDDEVMVRQSTRASLESFGCKVTTASDGQSALEIIRKVDGHFDLLITDVIMPRMTGRQLVEKVIELYPKLPFLFVSGYTDDNFIKQGIRSAEILLLKKPYSTAELKQACEGALSLRSAVD